MNTNWVDREPRRFGWRYWRLHDTGTRLFGPVHGAPSRFGRRFAEQAICPHTQPDADPLAINENCYCGIYYVPERQPFGELLVGDHWTNEWPGELRALTYGVAVGGYDADPVVPLDFMRTPRFRFLEMVVAPSRGDEFRARYPRVWTAPAITNHVLDRVEDSARYRLRGVDPAQFLEEARSEPVLPDSEHVCDVHPDHFGWRAWLIVDGDENGVELIDATDGLAQRLTGSPDGPYIENGEGVVYQRSLQYTLVSWHSNLAHSIVRHRCRREDYVAAFTFGYAPGSVDRPPDRLVSRRYNVLRICIPDEYAHLAGEISKRYGIEVTTSTTTRGLFAAEQSAWRELADTPADTLFPDGVSDPPVAPAPSSILFDGDTRPDPHAATAAQRAAAAKRDAIAAERAAARELADNARRDMMRHVDQIVERTIGGRPISPLELAATHYAT